MAPSPLPETGGASVGLSSAFSSDLAGSGGGPADRRGAPVWKLSARPVSARKRGTSTPFQKNNPASVHKNRPKIENAISSGRSRPPKSPRNSSPENVKQNMTAGGVIPA